MKPALSGKIAIVGANGKTASALSRCIQAHGMEPLLLKHGKETLDVLREKSGPEVLFLDLDAPEMNPSALLPRLHEVYPLLKVVVLSSDHDPQSVRMAMHNGVFDFLPKPLDETDLDQTMQRAISAAGVLHKTVSDYEELLSIEHELDVARHIQGSIIPAQRFLTVRDGYEISGRNRAAQKVGGDFFDFFSLEGDRLAFVIGDVASKGIPAAIFMAVSRTLFRTIAMRGIDPAECIRELNRILALESDPSMFIAVFYGILDVSKGEILYANGGHNPPMFVRSDGAVKILDQAKGIVLGVVEDTEYEVHHERVRPGDLFFIATDGFGELTDRHGRAVSDHFIKRHLIQHQKKSADQILDILYDYVEGIHPDSRSLSDDITCLLLKYQGHV